MSEFDKSEERGAAGDPLQLPIPIPGRLSSGNVFARTREGGMALVAAAVRGTSGGGVKTREKYNVRET